MAESRTDNRSQDVRQGLIGRLLTTLAQGFKWLVLSLIFSILIEWLGMVFWWPDEGLNHSRDMLAAEIDFLKTDFRQSLISEDPARFTKTLADYAYHGLFEATRIVDFVDWAGMTPRAGQLGLRSRLHDAFEPVAKYVLAAMQVTQVFSVRLAVLLLAMPVFVMFSLVAIVDGLVKRDLRRWGGGRESSFVYHWAKRTALPFLVLSWVIYLSLPFSVHPSLVVLPFATLFALGVAVTVSSFKKYL